MKSKPAKSNLPEVKLIAARNTHNEGYIARGRRWSTNDLIKAVEIQDLEPFVVPLASINLSILPWTINCLEDVIYHVGCMSKTNLKYPIILDEYGAICNGYHRVCKAILKGDKEIMAVRLKEMPRSEKEDDS